MIERTVRASAAPGLVIALVGCAAATAFVAAAPARAAAAASAPTMVVLDASGSMNTRDAPGSRIRAARAAVDGLVDTLPAGAPVGLEVYGTSTGSAATDKPAGCRDIKVVEPVGPIDRATFRHAVAGIRARGYTPIGTALKIAAAHLPARGPRSIVLVSDGEDTCAPPDPCTVAAQLHRAGVDLTIDTVGFKVAAAARRQLQCIAAATGGSYVDAPDGPTLGARLHVQVQRALRGYRVAGIPVTGSAGPAGAPGLVPGQYVDIYARGSTTTSAGDGTAKHYAITLHRGETPSFSATLIPPERASPALDGEQVVVTVVQGAAGACEKDGDDLDIEVRGKLAPVTAVVQLGAVGGASSCFEPGPATVEVGREGTGFAAEPEKMELLYLVEPAMDASGLPGPAAPAAMPALDASGPTRTVTAGASFNDAPRLAPGGYRDTFVSGETRYVRVHVGWGQRLAYSITPTRKPGLDILAGVEGDSGIASPIRQALTSPAGARPVVAFAGSESRSMFDAMPAPARYPNRSSTNPVVAACALSGDYYIVFSTGFGRPLFTDTYELRISLLGRPEAAPRPAPVSAPARTPAPPRTPRPAAPAPGRASAAASATGSAHPGGPGPAPVAGLVGAAVVLVGGLVWLVRRRRTGRQ